MALLRSFNVASLWSRRQPLRPGSLWLRYAIALGLILFLLMISHVFAVEALSRGKSDAANINESGRQRMLSQRIVLSAEHYTRSNDIQHYRILVEATDLFETAHEHLSGLAQNDSALRALYFEGDPSLDVASRHFIESARNIAADPQGAIVARREVDTAAKGALLEQLDSAVTGFERAADKRSKWLASIQDWSLFAAMLTLLGEALLIFWPSHQAVNRSVRELKDEVARTEAARSRLANFATLAADLFWETDLEGHITYADGRFLNHLKEGRETLLGCRYLDVIQLAEEDLTRIREAIQSLGHYAGVLGTFVDADGRAYKMELEGAPLFDETGAVVGYMGTADDVTSRVQEQQAITQLAFTDSLTGLANKRAFEEKLDALLEDRHPQAAHYLLALDLDGFKPVNDTYGHGAGDEVLKIVAARMKSVIRQSDWAARIGGDEFFVICADVPTSDAIGNLAVRLNDKLAEPYALAHGVTVNVSASIGIACVPKDATDRQGLVRAADTALYAAKSKGRNTFCFYSEDQLISETPANDPEPVEAQDLYYI